MSNSTRITRNALASWTSTLVHGVVAVFVVRILLQTLGFESYGLIVAVMSMTAFANLADFGLRRSLSRHLSASFSLDDHDEINRLFSTGLVWYATMGAILLLLYSSLAHLFVPAMKISGALQRDAQFLLQYYAGAAVLLAFLTPGFNAILIGRHRFDLVYLATILTEGVRISSIMTLVVWGERGVKGWAAAMLLSECFSLTLRIILAYRLWPSLQFRLRYANRKSFGELFSLSILLFVNEIGNMINAQTAPLILVTMVNPVASGLYKPAVQAMSTCRALVMGLVDQLFHLATRFHVTNQPDRVRDVLIVGTRYSTLMCIATCVVLFVFAQPIVVAWLGEDFVVRPEHQVSALALMIISVGALIQLSSGPQWEVLIGLNRVGPFAVLNLLFALLRVGLGIALVWWMQRSGWGLLSVLGVAIPAPICILALRSILVVFVTDLTGISLRRYLKEAYARPAIVLVAYFSFCMALKLAVQPASWLALGACLVLAGMAWLAFSWLWALEPEDRDRFKKVFQQVMVVVGVAKSQT